MKLVVNADDFGLTRGVNLGIIDAFRFGIVRSTTLMATGEAYDHALELFKENPTLGVGIHLVLTSGYPLADGHKTIIDEFGRFYKLSTFEEYHEQFASEEIEREFIAQIEKVLKSGVAPTHLDSHHHVHMLPSIQEVMKVLAKRYSLPYRGEMNFTDHFYGSDLTVHDLEAILEEHKHQEFLEVMSHPAYLDAALNKASAYSQARVREYDILTCARIKNYIYSNKIELINYRK